MKRLLIVAACFCLATLAGGPAAQAQTKESKIRYTDRTSGKEVSTSAVIKDESVEGITLAGAAAKKIPALDIVDVEYPVAITMSQTYTRARNRENEGNHAAAIKEYKDLHAKLTDAKDVNFKRHLEYKLALLNARMSDKDATLRKPAIAMFDAFMTAYPDSWQIIQFPKNLVPLQIKENDLDGAQRTLSSLAKMPKIPDDLRQELNRMSVRILLEAKKYTEAEKKLQDLIKALPPDDPQGVPLKISLAECFASNKKIAEAEKELKSIIATTKKLDVKALAFNTLGECYLNNKQPREAMWSFLYVDVIYNDNKEQHNRAMQNLYKVFNEHLKDEKKAKEYFDLLNKK